MISNEVVFWTLSTLAQCLAALIGLFYIAKLRYIDLLLNMRHPKPDSSSSESIQFKIMTKKQVKRDFRYFMSVISFGMLCIILDIIGLIFNNSIEFFLIVLAVSILSMVTLLKYIYDLTFSEIYLWFS